MYSNEATPAGAPPAGHPSPGVPEFGSVVTIILEALVIVVELIVEIANDVKAGKAAVTEQALTDTRKMTAFWLAAEATALQAELASVEERLAQVSPYTTSMSGLVESGSGLVESIESGDADSIVSGVGQVLQDGYAALAAAPIPDDPNDVSESMLEELRGAVGVARERVEEAQVMLDQVLVDRTTTRQAVRSVIQSAKGSAGPAAGGLLLGLAVLGGIGLWMASR